MKEILGRGNCTDGSTQGVVSFVQLRRVMENQEIERTLQFIVNQQAQFVTDIQQLREVQSVQQGQIAKITDAVIAVTGLVGRVAKAQEDLTSQQAEFARHLAESARQQAEFAKQQAEFAKNHAELEERFNAFVVFMERYLSDKGNGHK
jgi:hypothetical protein